MRRILCTRILLASWLALLVALPPAFARTWRDATGKFEVEAKLLSVEGDQVRLEKADGKVISVPVGRLSRADQDYLNQLNLPRAESRPTEVTTEKNAGNKGVQYGQPVEIRVTVGIRVTGVQGTATGLTGAVAFPTKWPEQEFEVLSTAKTPPVEKITYRKHPGGSEQLVVDVPRLAAGETAEARVAVLLRRRPIMPPADPSILSVPEKPPRDVRPYLASTPGIEVKNSRVAKIANELATGNPGGWELARKTFDWVCKNLEYAAGDLKGAVWAAEHGKGDCEEYTSLFIALCRANGIPARAVWVPGHCYPEFYLQDDDGQGHWIPCDAVGGEIFAQAPAAKMIMQKGDSFKVPEYRQPLRYLMPTLVGKFDRRLAPPKLEAILEFE